jgi:hypothetical protein
VSHCTRPGCEEEASRDTPFGCPPCYREWHDFDPDNRWDEWGAWANAHPKPSRIDWLSRYAAEAIAKPAKPAAPKDWRWRIDPATARCVLFGYKIPQHSAQAFTTDVAGAENGSEAQDFIAAHNQAVDALTAERDEREAELRQLRELAVAAVEFRESLARDAMGGPGYWTARRRFALAVKAAVAAREKGELRAQAVSQLPWTCQTIGAAVELLALRVKDAGIDGWPMETGEPGRSIVEKAGT